VRRIEAKGAALRILAINLDTATPTGKLMLNVLGSVAEFERSVMLERAAQLSALAEQTRGDHMRGKPAGDLVRVERAAASAVRALGELEAKPRRQTLAEALSQPRSARKAIPSIGELRSSSSSGSPAGTRSWPR
jgi:DNA invertase Pin-like site-specific DNA recombinase